MRAAARFLIQTKGSSGPWRTFETTTSEEIARQRADATSAETLEFGPSATAPKYPRFNGVRVQQGGKTVYDPRNKT